MREWWPATEDSAVNRRLFLLAPLLFFFSGCAVSARGADVPQIADLAETPTPEAVAKRDPVDLANDLIGKAFQGSQQAGSLAGIENVDGALIVVLDRTANTLSGAELFMRYCRAVAPVVGSDSTTAAVISASVVQPDGRTIAAVTVETAECSYR